MLERAEESFYSRGFEMNKSVERDLNELTRKKIQDGKIPSRKVEAYHRLLDRIEREILPHPVITQNTYTAWFKNGDFGRENLKHFLVQFSVFSNLFIEAQLRKTINAPTLDAMHASKEILMNELGVSFRKPGKGAEKANGKADAALAVDPDEVGTEGTIEGSQFHFAGAHFEWLLRMISHVGLRYEDIGKRRHGSKSTLYFCDELLRLYGSEDAHTALGASFSVENWAAAGFWKELIAGLEIFKKKEAPAMPIAFFSWHDRVEDQHAAHTWTELEDEYFSMELNEDRFISGGCEMLDGVLAFWRGLDEDRLRRG